MSKEVNKNIRDFMQRKINSLRDEISALDYTQNINNLKQTKYQKKTVLAIRSKIQVLNEVIISFGVVD